LAKREKCQRTAIRESGSTALYKTESLSCSFGSRLQYSSGRANSTSFQYLVQLLKEYNYSFYVSNVHQDGDERDGGGRDAVVGEEDGREVEDVVDTCGEGGGG